jgi:hypothetical protein
MKILPFNIQIKLFSLVIILFTLEGCIFQKNVGRSRESKEDWMQNYTSQNKEKNNTGGNAVGGSSSNESVVNSTIILTELLYLIDPKTGTVKKKVTIPKNSNESLYLTGINIGSLSNKILKVRFSFGRDLEPIEIPATIGTAPGLTPQTGIDVLKLDLKDRPFENLRLLYDMFDYPKDGDTDGLYNPTQDPYADSLYCRGLKSKDDGTFINGGDAESDGACDDATDVCLFAYAKIVDKGLTYSTDSGSTKSTIYPSIANIDTSLNKSGYNITPLSSLSTYEKNLELKNQVNKCLPNISGVSVKLNGTPYSNLSGSALTLSIDPDGNSLSTIYYYDSTAYEELSTSLWEIKSNAKWGNATVNKGVYGYNSALSGSNQTQYRSNLFPRAGIMTLRSDIEYLGVKKSESSSHSTPKDPSIQTHGELNLYSNATTDWINGCSVRVSHFDKNTNEGIGSCNVTGKITILALNSETNIYETVTETNKINLQIIRSSELNSNDENVLYTSFKTCFNSNGCAVDECCYNSRCWSKNMVSQCFEEAHVEGNKTTGESCSTDYECSSLCCNGGKCQVHDTMLETPVYCSKSTGASCVSTEWCHRVNIPTCLLVITGTDASGNNTCGVRCYNQLVNATCKNGKCIDPDPGMSPSQINYNPAAPDCSSASPAPTNLNLN